MDGSRRLSPDWGKKPFRQARHSQKGVMDPKSFNLYVGKLVNIKALGNICSKNMLLPIKNIIFFVNLWSNIMKYYYIVIFLYCLRDF